MRPKRETAPHLPEPQTGTEAARALYAEAAALLAGVLATHPVAPGNMVAAGARSFIGGVIHEIEGRERELADNGA